MDSIGRGLKAVAKGTEGCQQFEKTITLQNGSNSISLMAYNKNNTIESTRDSINITHREAITRKPTLHLLAIAVNSYRDGDLRLKYAIPDAKALAESVQKATGGLFEKVQLHTIYDAEATKEGIAETFARIGATTRREDVFLLYVAGHGITNRIDGAYYFLPYDFRYTGEDALTRQGVSENDFKKYLAQIQATKSLLLLDTCNSGSFAEAVASRGMIEKTAVNKLVRAVG
ncbi:caspase family protein, partial [bacterium]|nr:caspase family protein [bacterium]